jgi:peptidoglycan hydrolase-like protein with peptidoglycan-binding domain
MGLRAMLIAATLATAIGLLPLLGADEAAARGRANVAALQVGLHSRGLYGGTIDGFYGPRTRRAVRRLQRRARIAVDGIAGARTHRALGRRGRPRLGRRAIRHGMSGWDVAALQFLLAWHGFPSGSFDGVMGAHTDRALRRFQAWAGIGADGIAGARTVRAVRGRSPRSPLRLRRPVRHTPIGDRFGPRGTRFHAGVDFPAPTGWNVRAAGNGRVRFTGYISGYGNAVVLAHRRGVRTLYAHLSRILVRRGQRVRGGRRIALVGSTGFSTGPHLHFEVLVRGANVDPLSALR